MATHKVGVYRKYHGPVPKDGSGRPLPKGEWPKKRAHRWSVRWFGVDGKRYSKSFDTRKEAERFAETKQNEVREGKPDPCPQITLKEFRREHKELMKGNLAYATLRLHLAVMKELAECFGWNRMLHTVATRDLEWFRAKRLRTGLSPSSANKELGTLRRVFNLAILRGYLPRGRNPCLGIPMLRVASKRPRYVSPEEFERVYAQAPDSRWRAFLVMLYVTGLRFQEAMNLLWRDVDFETGQVHITRRTGEGLIQAWTPKDHEMRSLPLPHQAVGLLATWQSIAPEGCPYVFVEAGRWNYYRQAVRDGQWRPGQDLVNNVLRRFKTICRRAGLDSCTLHDLRRSCITNWAKQLPIHVVQQLAGHSDIQTTRQFYLSVQSEDVAKAQAVQAALLPPIPTADLTDPELTHSGRKRVFPARKTWKQDS